MKTLFTIVSLGLGLSLANAQTVKEADVPTPVKDALKNNTQLQKLRNGKKKTQITKPNFTLTK